VSVPGGKTRPERDADHSPTSSAEIKNEDELYSSTPWRLHGGSGTTLLFYFIFVRVNIVSWG
jgi:hypothetical protein